MQPIQDETEFLSSLEERILKAVEMVAALRKENAALNEKLAAANAARQASEATLLETRDEATRASLELESLHAERKQVRSRIEKLLGQMDLLSAS